MRAVTFQAPGEVLVQDVPEPELLDAGDAIVRIEASGVCGSDLHIYHGRVKIEPGFTIGHEYVGTVTGVGDDVRNVPSAIACSAAFRPPAGAAASAAAAGFTSAIASRTFGHGAALGELQGTQAEQALVPSADLVLRKVPAGHERRRRAVRRRRDGHRLPRRRRLRAAAPATSRPCSAWAPSGCAPCRPRSPPAPRT